MDGLISSPDKSKKRNNNILPPIEMNKSKDGSNLNDLDDLDDFLGNMDNKGKPNNLPVKLLNSICDLYPVV